MAILEVNSRKIDFAEQSFFNVKSVIPRLKKEFPIEEYTIESCTINGNLVEIESDDPNLIRPIETNDHIRFEIIGHDSSVLSLVNDVSDLLDKILKKVTESSELLKNNQYYSSVQVMVKSIEAIDTFIQSITYLVQEKLLQDERVEDLPIKELQIHLLSIIKAVFSAKKNKDYIMLTDLLEYELKDNLTQWKILIIPVMKQAVNQ